MTAPVLLTVSAAAARLGLPEKSLLRAAELHGHLVRIGRAVRIPESELGDLIAKCRCEAKVRASCCESAPADRPSGSSSTPASQSVRRAEPGRMFAENPAFVQLFGPVQRREKPGSMGETWAEWKMAKAAIMASMGCGRGVNCYRLLIRAQ